VVLSFLMLASIIINISRGEPLASLKVLVRKTRYIVIVSESILFTL